MKTVTEVSLDEYIQQTHKQDRPRRMRRWYQRKEEWDVFSMCFETLVQKGTIRIHINKLDVTNHQCIPRRIEKHIKLKLTNAHLQLRVNRYM